MADKVKALIAVLAPQAACDPCIAEKLGIASDHQVTHRTRALAGESGFERVSRACALCGETRTVTRRIVR